MHHVGTPALEIVYQDAGGGDTVHVVVAKYGDLLAIRDRLLHTRRGLVHVPHQEGTDGQLVLTLQKGGGLLRRFDAAGGEHGGHQIGIAGRAQTCLRLRLFRRDMPLAEPHGGHLPLCMINGTFIP